MRSRKDSMILYVTPRRSTRDGGRVEPYAGPVAVLLDELSASTSEVFAAGLRDLDRVRLFGQPTAGAALPSVIEKLPNGDLFQHAMMDFVRPNGEPVEGRPVQPDVAIELRREDLLAGRDATLEAALAWIDEQPADGPSTP
jgi:carboxyl-terminal processing protease